MRNLTSSSPPNGYSIFNGTRARTGAHPVSSYNPIYITPNYALSTHYHNTCNYHNNTTKYENFPNSIFVPVAQFAHSRSVISEIFSWKPFKIHYISCYSKNVPTSARQTFSIGKYTTNKGGSQEKIRCSPTENQSIQKLRKKERPISKHSHPYKSHRKMWWPCSHTSPEGGREWGRERNSYISL